MMTSGKPSFRAIAVCFVTRSGCSSRIYIMENNNDYIFSHFLIYVAPQFFVITSFRELVCYYKNNKPKFDCVEQLLINNRNPLASDNSYI